MIRFEDLLAARFLYQQLPTRRDVLLGGLDALHTAQTQRSLLAALVDDGVVTYEQARYVFQAVEHHKRERGTSIYAHLLGREGLPPSALADLRERLGDGDLNGLGELVLAQGLLDPAREQQLRFQARLVHDRDMAAQVQSHVKQSLEQKEGSSGGPARGVFASSQMIKGGKPPVPAAEEVSQLVRGTLSDADEELPGPRFRIPDWVDMADPRTGKQLEGYRILGRVGQGAMGTVYLCDRQEEPGKATALKLLPSDASKDAQGRFKREILANSFFSHPGALEIYDAGKTERGFQYLAMEFFDGRDLEQVLEEVTTLPPAEAIEIARQVFETLGAAHDANVVHRDVKPANILVSHDRTTAKLMDFGIAIVGDLGEFEGQVFRSMEGGVTGTPEYMSPEQASGEPITPGSDLYSMAVVLYHMLSGRLPFESETSSGFITCHMLEDPDPLAKAEPGLKSILPMEIHELMAALLQKNPKKRPQTASEIVQVLTDVLPKLHQAPSGTAKFLRMFGWGR